MWRDSGGKEEERQQRKCQHQMKRTRQPTVKLHEEIQSHRKSQNSQRSSELLRWDKQHNNTYVPKQQSSSKAGRVKEEGKSALEQSSSMGRWCVLMFTFWFLWGIRGSVDSRLRWDFCFPGGWLWDLRRILHNYVGIYCFNCPWTDSEVPKSFHGNVTAKRYLGVRSKKRRYHFGVLYTSSSSYTPR